MITYVVAGKPIQSKDAAIRYANMIQRVSGIFVAVEELRGGVSKIIKGR